LLQIYIAEEESKFGLDEKELNEILNSDDFKNLKNIKIAGLMGMATFTDNQNQIKKEFDNLKSIYDKFKIHNSQFTILSMGMSGDYKLAIDCGSTMIRIGSSIFGSRNSQ
jgi:pyridoxal phosphate enzyme (YggS family)